MRETFAIITLCAVIALSYAGSRGGGKPAEAVQCPNFEQLLAEKVAKEKQDRLDLAKARRDKIVNELHIWINP